MSSATYYRLHLAEFYPLCIVEMSEIPGYKHVLSISSSFLMQTAVTSPCALTTLHISRKQHG